MRKTLGQSRNIILTAATFALLAFMPARASAQTLAPQERLCDPSFENCRTDLLTYINQETEGIDAGFWLMNDDRYVQALINKWKAGVPVRILMDPRCVDQHEACGPELDKLKAAGLPMRYRKASGILHWKMMLFAGQHQLEFAGANYVSFEFVPTQPYVNYTDEVIYYTNDFSIVSSFMTEFDNLWTSTTEFANYTTINGPLTRNYPTSPISPDLNFPPDQSYRNRAVDRYNHETDSIDVMMFRITDVSHSNAMIAAKNRGVPVRLITDETEYRNKDRLWDAYNVDMMHYAGVQVRLDAHQGIDHEKAVILNGLGMAIFGSSNWTSPSTSSQREHNYFTTKPFILQWLQAQFERKWNNTTGNIETKEFVPLPPDTPVYSAPANMATQQPTTGMVLTWNGGLWGQLYDIYFGTTSTPPLIASDQPLGPSESATDLQSYALPQLQGGTTYYWKIVSKTMAHVTRSGPVWSFTTGGTGGGGNNLPAPWLQADVGNTGASGTASFTDPTFTVAGAGADVWGTTDAFHYVYQPLDGDGTIIARVATIQNTNAWAKVGVMIRSSLGANSAQAFMLVSPSKGTAFQRRDSTGASSLSSVGSTSTAPRWVKLVRAGSTITAFESANGTAWTQVGSDTFVMPSSVLVGLAVSSHVTGVNCTTTFDSVAVEASQSQQPTLPAGWSDQDIGAVSAPGGATFANNVYSVSGRGADIWGTADAFHYAYRTLNGDGTVIARVASVTPANAWSKGGLMIRESVAAGARHAFILVSSSKGVAFQRRATTNGTTVSTSGSLAQPPRWVKLTRAGNSFSAFESSDGSAWTLVGSATITMNANVLVGLAVTSHTTTASTTVTFDNVIVP